MADLTAEYVRELLDYDPETGVLTWRKPQKGGAQGIAGNIMHNGRKVRVGINGKQYLVHRVIWLMMTGAWPSNVIDHIDGNGCNNRWNNLRIATQSQNLGNSRRSKRNTTGFKGVHFFRAAGRYQASIKVGKKKEHLGYFDTAEQAHEAYCARAEQVFGVFHRTH